MKTQDKLLAISHSFDASRPRGKQWHVTLEYRTGYVLVGVYATEAAAKRKMAQLEDERAQGTTL